MQDSEYFPLLDSIDAGFCIIEMVFDGAGNPADYIFLEVNEAFESQTGLVGALGQRMRDLVPDHEQSWFDIYGNVVRTGQPIRFESYSRVLNRWFNLYAAKAGGSESMRVAVLFNDITAQKNENLRARFLADLSKDLASAESESDLIHLAVSAVGRQLKADRCYFVECWEREDRIRVSENWVREGTTSLAGDYTLSDFGGIEWWREYSAGNFAVEDVETHPLVQAQRQSYTSLQVRAYAVQPFRQEGMCTTVLAVTENVLRRWQESDLRLLDDVVARVWPLVARARADKALRESEARSRLQATEAVLAAQANAKFRTFFEQGVIFAGVMSVDGTLLETNRHSLDVTGFQREEVIGKKFWECGWWAPSPELVEIIREGTAVAAAGALFEREMPFHLADGSERLIELKIAPVRDEDGRVLFIAPTGIDITDRKRAEARDRLLLRLEEAMRAAEEPEAVMMAAAQLLGEYLQVDRCAYADIEPDEDTMNLTGNYTKHAGIRSIVGRMRFADFGSEVLRLMRANEPFVVHDVDRHQPPVENLQTYRDTQIQAVICVPLHKGGRFVAAVAVHSATPRRWTREEIEITALVAARSWESLARIRVMRELRGALHEVARTSRAKDEFLAALSHELRTPLTPVLLTTAVLESDVSLPEELRAQLTMMRRNIELEARLIDDLLDLTRISRGKLQIVRSPVDVHAILRHTVQIVGGEAVERKVELVPQLHAVRSCVLADSTRLQQVFWNLVKNALKFTPAGGKVTVTTSDTAEGRLKVRVQDTGVGISAAALPRIFRAFEQGDAQAQHRYGGLGLGLAIAEAIVLAHGGRIVAESSGTGQGALFTVELDLADGAPAEDAPTHPPAAKVAPRRMLVVEDHEATRDVLCRLLGRRGHDVTTAGTIAEGLDRFKAGDFDVVLSDLGLPDGNGMELIAQMHQIRPVFAIALSGYGMEEDVRRAKEAGFSAHLVKPVNMDQLELLLAQLATR